MLFGHVVVITIAIVIIHAMIANETRKSYERLALCCVPEMIAEKSKLIVNLKAIKTFALVTGILLIAWWPNCIIAILFTTVLCSVKSISHSYPNQNRVTPKPEF